MMLNLSLRYLALLLTLGAIERCVSFLHPGWRAHGQHETLGGGTATGGLYLLYEGLVLL